MSRAAQVALCGEPGHQARLAALLPLLELSPGDEVLEVGCGLGEALRALAALAPEGSRLFGVDSDPGVLAQAAGVPARLERMDGRALRFQSGRFDAVLCSRLLVVATAPELVLSEMARVLRPGGQLLAIEPAFSYLEGVDGPLRAKVLGQRAPQIGRALPKMLRALGLEAVHLLPHVALERVELSAERGLWAHSLRSGRCTTAEVEDYSRQLGRAGPSPWRCLVHYGVCARSPTEALQ